MANHQIAYLPVASLRPWSKNARTHSKKQIRQIADSIRRFGFTNPVLIDSDRTILAGHGRVAAARLLELHEVPCVRIETMTAEEKRAAAACGGDLIEDLPGLVLRAAPGTFADLFGLRISQGGLMNMLRRAQGTFVADRDKAVAALRQAKVVASDETGVRIEGSNAYQWVFRCSEAVVHQAAPTRGAVVVRTLMDGHRPDVWCSDRYVAQQGHGDAHQTCLAHLARDVAYADEASEDVLPSRLRLWLKRAFALADDVGTLAASTIATKRRALERSLDDILAVSTSCEFARAVQHKFRRARDQLLTFAFWPGMVEATNNGCERALRPAVIQRKVTNGYRAMWAAEGEADIRTVVDTARLRPGTNAFKTILQTVSA